MLSDFGSKRRFLDSECQTKVTIAALRVTDKRGKPEFSLDCTPGRTVRITEVLTFAQKLKKVKIIMFPVVEWALEVTQTGHLRGYVALCVCLLLICMDLKIEITQRKINFQSVYNLIPKGFSRFSR